MTRVVTIVEGDGEVSALPILLRRLGQWRSPEKALDVPYPIRVRRDRFLNKPEEFSRHLMLAAAKCEDDGWILILLDADDDCPASKGAEIVRRAATVVPHKRVAVVLANREYEAWFIAAASSLNGRRGFHTLPGDDAVHAESPRDAKGWMRDRMAGASYGVTTDQAAFSAAMDLELVFEHSRSFRKLCTEWTKNMEPIA